MRAKRGREEPPGLVPQSLTTHLKQPAISPGARNEDETLSTLKFASFARKPRTFTKRNEVMALRGGGQDVLALKLEVQALKQQLSITAGGGGGDQVGPTPRPQNAQTIDPKSKTQYPTLNPKPKTPKPLTLNVKPNTLP